MIPFQPFAVYTVAKTTSAFQWARRPPKLPIPVEYSPPNDIWKGSDIFVGPRNATNRQTQTTLFRL